MTVTLPTERLSAFGRFRRRTWLLVGALSAVVVVAVAVFIVFPRDESEPGGSIWLEPGQSVALEGYDTVAYFTVGKAMKGSADFKHHWGGADWHFANAKHRDMFVAEPERYTPQLAGFCAAGMTYGAMARADPKLWTIVDGQLYLNFDEYAQEVFRDNLELNFAKAEEQWARKKQELAEALSSFPKPN